MERKEKFKVCYINVADVEVTIFDSGDYKMCEHFAKNYQGEQKEVFIKKVFERSHLSVVDNTRPGSEL